MAKPFYSLEEVSAMLGKSPEEIREMVRAGTLREFRDSGKVFFKAEDVDKLAGGGSPASQDSGEITLEPIEEREPELPAAPDSEGSSVIGLEPAEADKPAGEEHAERDTVISASGIGVFDEDELEIDADPMAKTQITATPVGDQVALEGSGSGSGLLDLTRESDDTSLGAELLDEIYSGEEETAEAAKVKAEVPPIEAAHVEAPAPAELPAVPVELAPTPVIALGDPAEGLFSGLLVGALLLLAVTGSVVAGVLQGFLPDYARFLSNNFWFFLGGAVAVPILSLFVGWVIGKASTPRRV